MKRIDPNELPVLPLSGIICEECVALGIIDDMFVISYLERDYAIAFNFEELVMLGMADTKEEGQDISKEEIREIESPELG